MAKARFFCEHCHGEVSSRDRICPHCQRFFGDVRCPRCGLTGEAALFRSGCPSCGYAGSSGEGSESFPGSHDAASTVEYLPLSAVDPNAAGAGRPRRRRRRRRTGGRSGWRIFDDGFDWLIDPPPWFYLLAAAVLGVVVLAVFVWLLG